MSETIRVLLVDDEEDFYILTRELLAGIPGNHYEVDWVGSYDAALGVLEADQHAVWLVDYRLGAHDGLELMRVAISRGNKAPMILMTGQGDHEIDMAAMKLGASDYLPKNHLDARTLERSIRYALERSRSQESLLVSEMRFRSAFYGAVPGMALTSMDGRFLRVNRSLCDMLGYSVAELLVKSFQTIIHPDDLQGSQRLLETMMCGGRRRWRNGSFTSAAARSGPTGLCRCCATSRAGRCISSRKSTISASASGRRRRCDRARSCSTRRRRWRPSDGWPAVSRTISTTSSPSSAATPRCSPRSSRTIPRCGMRRTKSSPPRTAPRR